MQKLPILALKDMTMFPKIMLPLSVGRDFSKKAISLSELDYSSELIVAIQEDASNNNPTTVNDIKRIGVHCKILKNESYNKGESHKLLISGIDRVLIKSISIDKGSLFCEYEKIDELVLDSSVESNRALYDLFIKDLIYIIDKGFVSENLINLKDLSNPISTCYLFLSIATKGLESQKFLEINNAYALVQTAYKEVLKQKEYFDLKIKILEQAKGNMSKNQKEYFLKEQMKAIRKELGEDGESDVDSYIAKLANIKDTITKVNHDEILKNIKKLKNSTMESYEVSTTKNYLDYVFDLPWNKSTPELIDISNAKKCLDEDHYDMVKIKERILEYLSVKKLNPKSKAPIICFVGSPGTGKTSLAKSIARAIGRECVRISLGGVKDESEIRGHRKTYVGSMPGKIMQGMKQAGTINPVFVLDELDKLSHDFRGDPSSALLEVLDPEQNNTFKDHYINLEYDLSKVMFIATANNLETVPAPLKDRMEIIDVSGYCEEEKIEIAKRFIIPKKTKESGLSIKDLAFSDDSIREIIRSYTREFGVRELERQIAKICRKVAKIKAENKLIRKVSLNKKKVSTYLGVPTNSYIDDNKNGVGIVTGLAWTPFGGELLKLETILMEGAGETILTGRLGEVMQESAKIAQSLIRSNAKKWKIDKKIIDSNRVHIHAPSGSVQKEGPSAGVALVSSLVSLYTSKRIKDSIAMTGEITLTGKVLPVGGIKEKVLAAIRARVNTIILPQENKKDFDSYIEILGDRINVEYVSNISEVLKLIF